MLFSSSMSGVGVFILVTPASSTDTPASEERGRERGKETLAWGGGGKGG